MTVSVQTNANRAIGSRIWLMLILLGGLWGGSFFFARIAVQEITPLWLVFFRVSIAAAALYLFLAATGQWKSFRTIPFLPFLGLGLLNNAIPFSLIFAGQTEIGASLASILNATTPFLTVIAANLFTPDEKASPGKIMGTLLGIAGAVVIVGPAAFSGLGAPLWAQMAVIGAAASYALASVYAKRFRAVPPLHTATGQLSASTLIMLPVALLAHGFPAVTSVSSHAWLAVLALALASTAFAYTLFFRIIAEAGATVVSLVTLLVPVSAVLLGMAFLGESLSFSQLAGMGLIAAGLIVLNRAIGPKLRGIA
ncbi:MAG: DMT family transporter [Rhizobiaceae bacterium]